jgi:predicted transcriptional regulator
MGALPRFHGGANRFHMGCIGPVRRRTNGRNKSHRRARMRSISAGRLKQRTRRFRPAHGSVQVAKGHSMDTTRRAVDQSLVAKLVSSYVKKNHLPPADMPALINTVYQSLLSLGKPHEPEPPTPAVPIRRSVTRDYVVCLECGWRGHVLRRHLQARHGLSPDEYRRRWRLLSDHALVAPAYSERRSGIAKQLGLGRYGREEPPADTPAKPRRSRRRRATPDETPA